MYRTPGDHGAARLAQTRPREGREEAPAGRQAPRDADGRLEGARGGAP
jgi:hypothetical protein